MANLRRQAAKSLKNAVSIIEDVMDCDCEIAEKLCLKCEATSDILEAMKMLKLGGGS